MDGLLKRVPVEIPERFLAIVGLTGRFCDAHLNEERQWQAL